MTDNHKSSSAKLPTNLSKGYGKPPTDKQFKKGKSGNPSGRPKKDKMFKSVSRIVQDVLLKPVVGKVNGRREEMLMLEAVLAIQASKAMQGDTRAAKLLLDLGGKHVASHRTLTELMEGRPVFEFTKEDAARFTDAKLLEGIDELELGPGKKPIL